MNALINFLKQIYMNHAMIRAMALREIKKLYAGTSLGLLWSVIHPLVLILVFWFVFEVGFKVQVKGDIPFIVVFCCGLLPWITFSESLTASANAVIGNPHLCKKTVFPTEILPVVNIVANLITHGIMLFILFLVLIFNHISPALTNLVFLYYLFAMVVFCLGLSWMLSAINVFYRDLGQILTVVINIWFWMTPIVWPLDILPPKYHLMVKLNPFYYIVSGYKSAFIPHYPQWHHLGLLDLYFWLVCLSAVAAGGFLFKKLKPEFAEVL